MIIMLNALIALLGWSFSTTLDNAKSAVLKEKLNIIIEEFDMDEDKSDNKINKIKCWTHLLIPVMDDVEVHDNIDITLATTENIASNIDINNDINYIIEEQKLFKKYFKDFNEKFDKISIRIDNYTKLNK